MKTSKTILVTAFEPFGGETLNPTAEILNALPAAIGGCTVDKLLLPVSYAGARALACSRYDSLKPSAVVMLGQAGGRSAVSPETAGRNRMGGTIPDNTGYAPSPRPILEGGPDVLRTSLPVDRILEAVRSLGVPCEKSDDAGEYVCNALLYGMLAHNGGEVPTGFIHVPYIREQGHPEKPFLELADLCRAVNAALEAVAQVLDR